MWIHNTQYIFYQDPNYVVSKLDIFDRIREERGNWQTRLNQLVQYLSYIDFLEGLIAENTYCKTKTTKQEKTLTKNTLKPETQTMKPNSQGSVIF